MAETTAPSLTTIVVSCRRNLPAAVADINTYVPHGRIWPVCVDICRSGTSVQRIADRQLKDPADTDAYLEGHLSGDGTSILSHERSEVLSQFRQGLDDGKISVIGLRTSHKKFEDYRDKLYDSLRQTGLDDSDTSSLLKLHISETLFEGATDRVDIHSIHSLGWEILEPDPGAATDWSHNIRVHRLLIVDEEPTALGQGLRQLDQPIRLLVVIARQCHNGASVDPLSSVFDSLCSLVQYLQQAGHKNRLKVFVIRPGTLMELQEHLKQSATTYDMIHIDVHGVLEQDACGKVVPNLRFASASTVGSLENVQAITVAEIVGQHSIAAVALSACMSSHAQSGPAGNMCHVFAAHGRVRAAMGMTAKVDRADATAYYKSFYAAVVLGGCSFRDASAVARAAALTEIQCRRDAHVQELADQRKRQHELYKDTASLPTEDDPLNVRRDWPFAATYIVAAKGDIDDDNTEATIAAERLNARTNSSRLGIGIIPLPLLKDSRGRRTLLADVKRLVRWPWNAGENDGNDANATESGTTSPCNASGRMATSNMAACLADFHKFHIDKMSQRVPYTADVMAFEANILNSEGLAEMPDCRALFVELETRIDYIPFHEMREGWLLTGFADRVEIINAARFCDNKWLDVGIHPWRSLTRSWLSRRHGDKTPSVNQSLPATANDNANADSSTRDTATTTRSRIIVIIEHLDAFANKSRRPSRRELDRINAYIDQWTRAPLSDVYLILAGHESVPWRENSWSPSKYKWVTAQYFKAHAVRAPLRRDMG